MYNPGIVSVLYHAYVQILHTFVKTMPNTFSPFSFQHCFSLGRWTQCVVMLSRLLGPSRISKNLWWSVVPIGTLISAVVLRAPIISKKFWWCSVLK